jgi:hypothetical protein
MTVEKFLRKIGKNCVEHADKFKSWEELMTLRSYRLKKLGIPLAQRKWILKFVWKYREGRLEHYRWDWPEVREW